MTTEHAPSVEALLASFPVQATNISTITGKPDRVKLNELILAIRQNAASVYSVKGGGTYGHIGLTMSGPEYQALPNTVPFVKTPHPGSLTIPESATAAAREDTRDLYNRNLYTHRLEQNVALALKNIFMSKLEESTYLSLKRDILHYSSVTLWQLITHLLTKYGEKTVEMLTDNLAAMEEAFDISQPSIDGLFIRQDKLQRFAADTPQTISDGYWLLRTLNVIKASGLLHKGVQKWNANTAAYKTVPHFKIDFPIYHEEYLKKRENDSTADRSTAYSAMTDRLASQEAAFNAFQEMTTAQTNM